MKALCRKEGITDSEFLEFDGGDIPNALLDLAQAAEEFYRSCQRKLGYSDETMQHFISESIDEQISGKYRYYARVTATGGRCL